MHFIRQWLNRRKGRKEYASNLLSSLKDFRLDSAEKSELERIVKQFELRPDDTLEAQKEALAWIFDAMASDKKITDQEKKSLQELTNYFGRNLTELKFDQSSFNKFHTLAKIETGVLPQIQVEGDLLGLVLKNGEELHWACAAAMMKRKRVTKRINYSGFTGSVKIMKGVRYRVGSINVGAVSSEFLAREDAGWLWLSNQRIGFKGPRKHFAVPYSKIASFEISEGVLNIFKDGRENPHLVFLTDYDVPCAILSMILNQDEPKTAAVTGR